MSSNIKHVCSVSPFFGRVLCTHIFSFALLGSAVCCVFDVCVHIQIVGQLERMLFILAFMNVNILIWTLVIVINKC